MFTEAEITGNWLTLWQFDETGANINELELRLSDYADVEDALSSNGYELAGDWENGRADIWAL